MKLFLHLASSASTLNSASFLNTAFFYKNQLENYHKWINKADHFTFSKFAMFVHLTN